MSKRFDVLVIGGGPAGATAAALLASWGRSVVLLHHDSKQPSLAESLPSSTRKLLRFLGQLAIVDAAGFHPNHGNISRWAGREATAPTVEPGYHVSRAAFDSVLRDHARALGASIVHAHVQRVDLCREGPAKGPAKAALRQAQGGPEQRRRAGPHRDSATVECTTALGVSRYQARFVLDCSGRAGIIARRGLRRTDAGYRTLAVAAEWDCPDWPPAERTHTFVDSYRNGWAWSVPLSATRRQCTVMIDAELTKLRKANLASVYRAELRKALSIDARLAQSRQVSAPWACDASLYSCVRAADSRALLVGDAASFIEPLSSAGVKKALASAWRAAVVVNTAIDKPEMLAVALDYHDRREREVYQDCVRRSAQFFKEAAAIYDDDFWSVRAACDQAFDQPQDFETDGSVRLAFDALCNAARFDLTVNPRLQIAHVTVIEDRELVLRDGVMLPGVREPVRFAAGINLPELIHIAAGCHDIGSLMAAYHDRVGMVDPRSVLLGLSLLVARGLMVPGDGLSRAVMA